MFRAPLLASVAMLALFTAPLAAQESATAAQRDAVFQQMLADPANRSLMQQYAQLSVQMRDFEAAAATLERLVDLEPDNSAARIELAIAYFALGSYAVAEYHLAAAQASGTLSPEQSARVARYQAESVERGDGSELDGRVEAGFAHTFESDETGLFLNAALDLRLDLGDANVTTWVTELGFTSFQPGENSTNQRNIARLRSGPEFRFSGTAYGPRLQPFAEIEWVSRDPTLAAGVTELSAGLAYQNPLNERFTAYAEVEVGYGMPDENSSNPDYTFHEASLGLTYRPSRDTRLRLSGWVEEQQQESTVISPDTTEISGARLSVQHAFDPGFGATPNRWIVGGFAQTQHTEISDQFSMSDIEERSFGAWLRAFVYEDIYVETGLAQVTQDRTNFGLTNTTEETVLSMQVGWEF